MKKFYNTIIDWTFVIINVLVYIPLFAIKVTMLFIIQVAEAILFVRKELVSSTRRITVGLTDRLSVRDWLGLSRVWELVGVCGGLQPIPLLSLLSKFFLFYSL